MGWFRIVDEIVAPIFDGLRFIAPIAWVPFAAPRNPNLRLLSERLVDSPVEWYGPARLVGNRDWVRAGAVEMALDCLRRHLLGLPVDERIDFERR